MTATSTDPGAFFGDSVYIDGSNAVIGAPLHDINNYSTSGLAYIFGDSGAGWTQMAILNRSDPAANDWFGLSVSISGDFAVAGSHWDDDNGSGSGSAYVFERDHPNTDAWGQRQKLLASDGDVGDHFGQAVAVSSDTAIIGAPNSDNVSDATGSAYIFEQNHPTANAWGERTEIVG